MVLFFGKVKVVAVFLNQTTISKHACQTAENSRNEILPVINNIFWNFGGALTFGFRTVLFCQIYIAISCHYINDNLELKFVVFSTSSFHSISKISVNILSKISNILRNIHFDVTILNQSIIFLADEGSNIMSALKCYKRQTCICHLINTVLIHCWSETAGEFPNFKDFVENCKSLVKCTLLLHFGTRA